MSVAKVAEITASSTKSQNAVESFLGEQLRNDNRGSAGHGRHGLATILPRHQCRKVGPAGRLRTLPEQHHGIASWLLALPGRLRRIGLAETGSEGS